MKKNVPKKRKILNKIYAFISVFLAVIMIYSYSNNIKVSAYVDEVDYESPFLFAYDNKIYFITLSDTLAPLTGENIRTFDSQFYFDWDGAILTSYDYASIVDTEKNSLFISAYGSPQGAIFGESYYLYQITGGGALFTITSVNDTAILFLTDYPQYTVTYDGVNDVWLSLSLKQFFDLQDLGYDIGFIEGYNIGFDDGVAGRYIEGYNDGYKDGEAYGYADGYEDGEIKGYEDGEAYGYADGYEDGLIDGYEAPENEKTILTFVGSILGAIFSFIWLVLTAPNVLGINLLTVLIVIGGIIVIIIGLKMLL
jgi:hypothetical protein